MYFGEYRKACKAGICYRLAKLKGYTGSYEDFANGNVSDPVVDKLRKGTEDVASPQDLKEISDESLQEWLNIPPETRRSVNGLILGLTLREFGHFISAPNMCASDGYVDMLFSRGLEFLAGSCPGLGKLGIEIDSELIQSDGNNKEIQRRLLPYVPIIEEVLAYTDKEAEKGTD